MFNQVTEAAKKFVREFENEDLRLVRSANSFEKFAEAEGIEVKRTKLKTEGALKKRYALWSTKAGHGIIGNKKDVDKFIKLCDEVEDITPKRRGRPAKTEAEDTPVKKRGPKYIKEEKVSKRGRKPKEKEEVGSTIPEPEIYMDIDPEYPVRKNVKEFAKGFKEMFDFLNIDQDTIDAKVLAEAISKSQTMRDLIYHAAETFN